MDQETRRERRRERRRSAPRFQPGRPERFGHGADTPDFLDFAIMHVPKTAGTALRIIVKEHLLRRPDARIGWFEHRTTLPDIVEKYPDAKVIFFGRDPVARYVSAFNCRQRFSQPKFNVPWSREEEFAYTHFHTPNRLGIALGAEDEQRVKDAERAMQGVRHIRWNLAYYFRSPEYLEENRRRIAFIGMQETFEEDVGRIRSLLAMDPDIEIPDDPVSTYRGTSKAKSRKLFPRAVENLRRWHETDYRIFDWCQQWRREQLSPGSTIVQLPLAARRQEVGERALAGTG